MADFREPDAGYETAPARPTSDAPVLDAAPSLTPQFSSSGMDGGTRPLDPIESFQLFNGMYDEHPTPPSTYQKATDLKNLEKAGIDQAKSSSIGKAALKLKEQIVPSPPLCTQPSPKKVGPLDTTVSVSLGAPSQQELRDKSLANPKNQRRPEDAQRSPDAGRTTYKAELPDGGTQNR